MERSNSLNLFRLPSGNRGNRYYKVTRYNGYNHFYENDTRVQEIEDTTPRYSFDLENQDHPIEEHSEKAQFHMEDHTEDENQAEVTTDDTINREESEENNQTRKDENNGMFNYLPIDLFKQVHRTLKSQPVTLDGKIQFLRSFERTLIGEIGEEEVLKRNGRIMVQRLLKRST